MPDKLSVLRACREVVKEGGRIGGYTIHTAAGLSHDEAQRAAELGPSEVFAAQSPADQLEAAGFVVLVEEDVTVRFRETLETIRIAMNELEEELRRDEGDSVFEEWRERRGQMLQGLMEGLLRRSLLVAVKT